MKYALLLNIFSLFFCIKLNAQQYHTENNFKLLREGYSAFKNANYTLADSLCVVIISNGNSKIEKSMPIELNPYYLKGQSNFMQRNFKQAIVDFNHLGVDTTTNLGVLATLSECHKLIREFDNALNFSNRLILLQPTNSYFISHRGDCYLYAGKKALACADYKKAQTLGIDDISKAKQIKACR